MYFVGIIATQINGSWLKNTDPLPSPEYREEVTLFDKSYITVGQVFEGLPAAKYSKSGHRV